MPGLEVTGVPRSALNRDELNLRDSYLFRKIWSSSSTLRKLPSYDIHGERKGLVWSVTQRLYSRQCPESGVGSGMCAKAYKVPV